MPTTPAKAVMNQDVVGLYNRINRFIVEVNYSVSSGLSFTNEFDTSRLRTYLDAIDRYQGWISGQPFLDLPETTPTNFVLADPPLIIEVDNDDLADVARLLAVARDELINSQSARMGTGLTQGPLSDTARLKAIIAKARAFLETYIVPTTPLDLPESSPRNLTSGPGRVGT